MRSATLCKSLDSDVEQCQEREMSCQQRVFSSPVGQRGSGNKPRFGVELLSLIFSTTLPLNRQKVMFSKQLGRDDLLCVCVCVHVCVCVWVKERANCHLCFSRLSHSRDASAQQLPLASLDARSSSGSFGFPASTQVIGPHCLESVTMWWETLIWERSDETCQLPLNRSSNLSHESSERRS